MEQLVFILLIALVSFIHWIFQQSAKLREKQRAERRRSERMTEELRPVQPVSQRPVVADDPNEGMRKLMEALGLPQDAPPPMPARRAEPALPPPALPVFLPPPTVKPKVSRPAPVPEVVSSPGEGPSGPPLHSWKVPASVAVAAPSRRPARNLLKSPGGLREAMVLSEILGPPKALQTASFGGLLR